MDLSTDPQLLDREATSLLALVRSLIEDPGAKAAFAEDAELALGATGFGAFTAQGSLESAEVAEALRHLCDALPPAQAHALAQAADPDDGLGSILAVAADMNPAVVEQQWLARTETSGREPGEPSELDPAGLDGLPDVPLGPGASPSSRPGEGDPPPDGEGAEGDGVSFGTGAESRVHAGGGAALDDVPDPGADVPAPHAETLGGTDPTETASHPETDPTGTDPTEPASYSELEDPTLGEAAPPFDEQGDEAARGLDPDTTEFDTDDLDFPAGG